MFDIFFGWRKASKCKRMIKRVRCRLQLLKNKRCSIVKHLRDDMAQLIKNGREECALKRAEQLFKDESMMSVYELLDNFCEFIASNLSYIRKNKDCPNDINEAVSSLIFASARCGDLPELCVIRKLFGERYGQRFAMAALELLPGNLVNDQVKEKLSPHTVPDYAKFNLVDKIARNDCLQPEILAIEYASELQQMQENSTHRSIDADVDRYNSRNEGSQVQAPLVDCIKLIQSPSNDRNRFPPDQSPSHWDSGPVTTSISSSIVQQSSKDTIVPPMHNPTVSSLDTKESLDTSTMQSSNLETQKKRTVAASSSESLPRISDDKIVYLDDIEEIQSSIAEGGEHQDKRLFKFTSPEREKFSSFDECEIDQCEARENSSVGSCQKSIKASSKKLSRRRSVSQEAPSMKDVEFLLYYDKPRKSTPSPNYASHHCIKHQKKIPTEEIEQLCSEETAQRQPYKMRSYCHCCSLQKMNLCSLEHPCFCVAGDHEDSLEVLCRNHKRENRILVGRPTHDLISDKLSCDHWHSAQDGESDDEIGWKNLPPPRPQRKSCENGAPMYPVFTYADDKPNSSPGSCAPNGLCPNTTRPRTGKYTLPPYSRAMTMPPERCKDDRTNTIMRSCSFPDQHPNHVHPKLPDYDYLEAKFRALKEEHLHNNYPLEWKSVVQHGPGI